MGQSSLPEAPTVVIRLGERKGILLNVVLKNEASKAYMAHVNLS